MKNRSIMHFFQEGFILANRTIYLYLINVLFLIFTYIIYFNNVLSKNIFLIFLSVILFFITVGYSLSLPLFLLGKKDGGHFSFAEIVSITLNNTRRIIVPLILIGLILTIPLGIVLSLLRLIFSHTLLQRLNPLLLVAVIIFPASYFTPCFFSIEKEGLCTAIKNSFRVAYKSLRITCAIGVLLLIYYAVSSFISSNDFTYQLIKVTAWLYVNLVLTASTLQYFNSEIKPKLKNKLASG